MAQEPADLICRRAVQGLHKGAALHPNKPRPEEPFPNYLMDGYVQRFIPALVSLMGKIM